MKFIYSCLIVLIGHAAFGQFSITGEIRPRAEFRDGFKTLSVDGLDPAFFIEQRSRLSVRFADEKFSYNLTLQDVRLWGENSQIYKSDNALFSVYEAWGQYNFNSNFSVKLGRQEVNYDEARIFGNLGWAQQGRSHDLARFQFKKPIGNGTLQLQLGLGYNQEDVVSAPEPRRLSGTFYSGVNNYKTIQFLWFNLNKPLGKFSFLLLNNGVESSDSVTYYSQTAGIYFKKNLGLFDLSGEGYYQFGNDGTGRSLQAYLGSVKLGVLIAKSSLTLGVDIVSGTPEGSTTNQSFTPFYGTNHKFYGLMDYFYVGNPHRNAGLVDFFLKWKQPLGKKSDISIHAHQFLSEISLQNESGQDVSQNLGSEIDLVFKHIINSQANLQIGYSRLLATDSMELIKSGDSGNSNQWAWAMFTLKSKFFEK